MSTADLILRLRADADQAIREMGRVEDSQHRLGAGAKAAGLAAGAALTTLAVQGVRAFADLDTGMREVFTLMPGMSAEAMGQMTDDVRAFAVEYGLTTDQVVPALYQAISAGVPADNVLTFLTTAAQTARGGVTDISTAVNALSTLVNAYGADVMTAADASDILFTAMRLGKTTIGELSDSLFQVVPVAAASGVQFDQIASALVAITLQGTPTRVAATNLRGALVELGKEGTVAFDAFEKAAGQTFPEFVAQGGDIGQAFVLLSDYALSAGTTIQNEFGSIEGGMAATVLASQTGAAAFGGAMDQMGERAGATGTAFETMAGGVGFGFDQLKAGAQEILLTVGEELAPTLSNMLPTIIAMAPAIASFAAGLFKLLEPVGYAIAALGTLFDVMTGGPPMQLDFSSGTVSEDMLAVEASVDSVMAAVDRLNRQGFQWASDPKALRLLTDDIDQSNLALWEMYAAMGVADEGQLALIADSRRLWEEIERMASAGDEGALALLSLRAGTDAAAAAALEAAGPEAALTAELEAQAAAAQEALTAQQTLDESRRKAIDPLYAAVAAETALGAAHTKMGELEARAAAGGVVSQEEWDEAIRETLETQGDFNLALDAMGLSSEASEEAIRALGAQAGLSEGMIQSLIDMIDRYNDLRILRKTFELYGTSSLSNNPPIAYEAAGGFNPSPTLAVVGEEGPELVSLPGGSTVWPHGTGPGSSVNVVLNVGGSIWALDDLTEEIEKRLVRTAASGGGSLLLAGG